VGRFGEATLGAWRDAGLNEPSAHMPVLATSERGLALPVMGHLSAAVVKVVGEGAADLIG
jgi:hypothetical protein